LIVKTQKRNLQS